MKNKKMTSVLKSGACILLLLALILAAGCSGGGEENSSGKTGSASAAVNGAVSDTASKDASDLGSGASAASTAASKSTSKGASSKVIDKPPEIVNLPKINLTDKKVITLSHVAPEETTQRAYAGAKRDYGLEVETIVVPYNNMAVVLAQKINAGEQVDIAPCYSINFTTFLKKGYGQDLSKYIDFSDKIWAERLAAIEKYMWKGKKYVLSQEKFNGRMIWFNTKIFKKAGLPTPLELFDQGKWDWNAMLDLAKDLTLRNEEGTISQYGFAGESPQLMLVSATGEDFVKFEKSGVVNNFRSANVAKAYTFLQDLTFKHKVMPPYTQMQDFNLLAQNKVAMGYYGAWYSWTVSGISDRLKAGDFGFAPAPKMPGAKPMYEGKGVGGCIIPTVAKNPKGAAALLIYMEYFSQMKEETLYGPQSPEYKQYINAGWSKDMIRVYQTAEKGTKISNVYQGIGNANDWAWEPVTELLKGTPWATIVEKYTPKMQEAIDQFMQE